MNWIILIIASLFEIGFATSLGKLKTATGNAYMMWFGAFVICLVLSVYPVSYTHLDVYKRQVL